MSAARTNGTRAKRVGTVDQRQRLIKRRNTYMQYSKLALEAKDSLIRQISMLAEKVDKPFKLYFGESDMTTPEFICRAAYEALQQGHTFYTNTAGYLELRQAIARKFHEVHGVQYRPSEVVCT